MVALNLDDANIHELGDDDCHRRQKVAHLQAYHRWTHATNSGGSEKKMLIYTHYGWQDSHLHVVSAGNLITIDYSYQS